MLSGSPKQMCLDYFRPIFGAARGNVDSIKTYLTAKIAEVQEEAKKISDERSLGLLFFFISSHRRSAVTSINYISIKGQSKTWVQEVKCGSDKEKYEYKLDDYRIRWNFYHPKHRLLMAEDDD